MPAFFSPEICQSQSRYFPTGNKGFGTQSVCGLRRLPRPAAKISARISVCVPLNKFFFFKAVQEPVKGL